MKQIARHPYCLGMRYPYIVTDHVHETRSPLRMHIRAALKFALPYGSSFSGQITMRHADWFTRVVLPDQATHFTLEKAKIN